MAQSEKLAGREYVTLYVVYDDFGRKVPTLKSVEALVCAKTYKFWPFWSEWHGCKSSIRKTHSTVHLTPEAALSAYVDVQEARIKRGKLAAVCLSQARAMLIEFSRT